MEQLDYLWDYQELDLKINDLDTQKKDSLHRKELTRAIRYLKNQQQGIIKLNNDIDKKNHIYNRIHHEFESINKSLEQEGDILESGEIKAFKQLEQIEQKISEAEEKLAEKKQELMALSQDMESLNKRLQSITLRLRKGKKDYDRIKKEYDLSTEEINAQYKEIKSQMDAIKGKLNNSLLRKYEAVKNSHASAMAEIEGERCGGCNMALASLVIQNVKSKAKLIECENCGRILYSKSDAQEG